MSEREIPFQLRFVLGSAKAESSRKTRTRQRPSKLPTSLSEMKEMVNLDDKEEDDGMA